MPDINPQNIKELRALVEQQLQYTLCVSLNNGDIFNAVALAIRHFQQDHFLLSQKRQREERKKRVYYLSMEFLLGQSLRNNLLNMNLLAEMHQVVNDLGFDLDHLLDEEPDAALGNGGLGRLAACFIDSMATLILPHPGMASNTNMVFFANPFKMTSRSSIRMTGIPCTPRGWSNITLSKS